MMTERKLGQIFHAEIIHKNGAQTPVIGVVLPSRFRHNDLGLFAVAFTANILLTLKS
jgi:hypothetical protein